MLTALGIACTANLVGLVWAAIALNNRMDGLCLQQLRLDRQQNSIALLADRTKIEVDELRLHADFNALEEPARLPPGEIREVVRSYLPPYRTEAWTEIAQAAARESTGWSWGKDRRGEAIHAAGLWMSKLDRVARAARLHLDGPGDETAKELDAALKDAGLETSRKVEGKT